jgi:hypothetical protein
MKFRDLLSEPAAPVTVAFTGVFGWLLTVIGNPAVTVLGWVLVGIAGAAVLFAIIVPSSDTRRYREQKSSQWRSHQYEQYRDERDGVQATPVESEIDRMLERSRRQTMFDMQMHEMDRMMSRRRREEDDIERRDRLAEREKSYESFAARHK